MEQMASREFTMKETERNQAGHKPMTAKENQLSKEHQQDEIIAAFTEFASEHPRDATSLIASLKATLKKRVETRTKRPRSDLKVEETPKSIKKRVHNGCERKRCFSTLKDAQRAAAAFVFTKKRQGAPISIFLKPYECPNCGGFHLGRTKKIDEVAVAKITAAPQNT